MASIIRGSDDFDTAATLRGIQLGTMVATTSGTSIDFTGIPAGVRRVTLNLVGVSANASSVHLIQIGDSGGVETSGYLGSGRNAAQQANFTQAFGLAGTVDSTPAVAVQHGTMTLTLANASTFTWVSTWQGGRSNEAVVLDGAGSKSLSAVLDRVRLTTVSGSAVFDAGSMNITWEF